MSILDAILPKKKRLPRTNLRAGGFIGYRVWELHNYDGVPTLRSWVYECFWQPGDYVSDLSHPVSGCDGDDAKINDYNERGVWAFSSYEGLFCEFGHNCYLQNLVWGSVFMWGTIIEHSKGYRAQYARVRGLDSVDAAFSHDAVCEDGSIRRIDDQKTLAFLQQRYGVGTSDGS